MPQELSVLANCEVRSGRILPNQARTLEVFHAVRVDNVAALAIGDAVTYTDPDLGLWFVGKIVNIKKEYKDGEGIIYECADVYRTLSKQAAKRICNGNQTTKIQYEAGTSVQLAITQVTQGVSIFPGGTDMSGIVDVGTPAMDKAGQTIDTWLDDLLSSVDGGIAYVDPNAGNPKLVITDFYGAPPVALTTGSYNVVNPASGDLLLKSGSIGKSINRKYGKITIEGSGRYRRFDKRFIFGRMITIHQALGLFQCRWYIDDKYILKRYIDENGTCQDGISMRLRVGGNDNPSAKIYDITNPPFGYDPDEDRFFFWYTIKVAGATFGGLPQAPQLDAWFSYTVWTGPYTQTVIGDATLTNEGEYVEQHPEFYRYESPWLTVDFSTQCFALLTALQAKHGGTADISGSVVIHIKGLEPDLQLGSAITNFDNMRVRQLGFNFVTREMQLEVSNIPLREDVSQVKNDLAVRTVLGRNWYNPQNAMANDCFKDQQFTFDSNCQLVPLNGTGDGTSDPDGPDPGGVDSQGDRPEVGGGNKTTWDCQKGGGAAGGKCVKVRGPGGAFKTFDDCDRVCTTRRFDFVQCTGCVEAPFGQYETAADCEQQNPKPTNWPDDPVNCKWNCDPQKKCVPNPNGVFATKAACEAVCQDALSGSGVSSGPTGLGGIGGSGIGSGIDSGFPPLSGSSGSGGAGGGSGQVCCPSGMVVKCVKIDKYGHVYGVECIEAFTGSGSSSGCNCPSGVGSGGGCASGATGTATFLCGIACSGSELIVQTQTIEVINGCTVDLGECV